MEVLLLSAKVYLVRVLLLLNLCWGGALHGTPEIPVRRRQNRWLIALRAPRGKGRCWRHIAPRDRGDVCPWPAYVSSLVWLCSPPLARPLPLCGPCLMFFEAPIYAYAHDRGECLGVVCQATPEEKKLLSGPWLIVPRGSCLHLVSQHCRAQLPASTLWPGRAVSFAGAAVCVRWWCRP